VGENFEKNFRGKNFKPVLKKEWAFLFLGINKRIRG
jgi:hypothetical protein